MLETLLRLFVESKLNPKQRAQAREIELYVKAARTARWYHAKEDLPWPAALRKTLAMPKYKDIDGAGLARYLDLADSVFR